MQQVGFLFHLIVIISFLIACGPLGPIPGGRLNGDLAPPPASGWAMFASLESLQLEVRPDKPHSVTVSCVVADGRLYVSTGRAERSVWAGALIADARARVKVGPTLYEVQGVRVREIDEIQVYLDAYRLKYGRSGGSLSGFQSTAERAAPFVLFRLELATRPPSENWIVDSISGNPNMAYVATRL